MEFSEKSWIYLLACQLILCDGLPSVVAAFSGLLAGFLYDRDGYGIQNYRLPQRVEVSLNSQSRCFGSFCSQAIFSAAGTLVNSLLPQRNAATAPTVGRTPPATRAPAGTANQANGRQNLMNPFDVNNYGGGEGGGLADAFNRQHQQFQTAPSAAMPRYPPPDEDSILTLMVCCHITHWLLQIDNVC